MNLHHNGIQICVKSKKRIREQTLHNELLSSVAIMFMLSSLEAQ